MPLSQPVRRLLYWRVFAEPPFPCSSSRSSTECPSRIHPTLPSNHRIDRRTHAPQNAGHHGSRRRSPRPQRRPNPAASAKTAEPPPPLPPAPDALFSMSRLRDYKCRRSSSWDQTGGNADSLRVEPGQSATLLEVKGAGVITHIWFTINSLRSHASQESCPPRLVGRRSLPIHRGPYRRLLRPQDSANISYISLPCFPSLR